MSNFTRYFGGGFTALMIIPSAWVEKIDALLTKLPNATDGSSHVGSCEFGGLKAPHMTRTSVGSVVAVTGNVTQSCDCDVATHFRFSSSNAADKTLTLDFSNLRVGDTISVEVDITLMSLSYDLTLAWAGAGVTHYHDESGYEAQIHPGEIATWTGYVFATNKVQWVAHRRIEP